METAGPDAMRRYRISILLPTRGRDRALGTSISSLIDLCDDIDNIEFRLGFDHDDTVGKEYFTEHVQPMLEQREIAYTALEFDRLGYERLNVYYNHLASGADSDWLFVWNDDAIMETQGWDTRIREHDGRFCLLRVQTHRSHPYSIFPIYPKQWYDLFGFCSRHQMIDAELSQVAYMLDIMENVEIEVTHDRADLTGNNLDDTQKKKRTLEGNPQDPRDFHNRDMVNQRLLDCETVARYLEKQGKDISFWHEVKTGQRDPWIKLRKNDVNDLTKIIKVKR
jgi:hypothetical protein